MAVMQKNNEQGIRSLINSESCMRMGDDSSSSALPEPRTSGEDDGHRHSRSTTHLEHFKPIPDCTSANQSQVIRFQMQQSMSMHRTAIQVIDLLRLNAETCDAAPSAETLTALARTLSDYRGQIRQEAHKTFGNALLNTINAKINTPKTPESLTLKGHATQTVMRALRNTLIDEGISLIQVAFKKHNNDDVATLAVFRLATAIEFLDVSRFNPLLAYHDIDHTLWVVQGSMAIVAGAYEHALTRIDPEHRIALALRRNWDLHKTMLFSAAHDSFFEFETNSIVRHRGRRDAHSSEGLSAHNLKALLERLSEKLNCPGVSDAIDNTHFHNDLLEAIYATVPHFVNKTVSNGALAIAKTITEIPTQFLCRIATALADLEESLMANPQRFIAKSLLLNQEGSPSIDMSLIEHRSGVILTLSNHDAHSLTSTVADKMNLPGFADALYSWQHWMSTQPNFALGRQREAALLINTLITQSKLFHESSSTEHTNTTLFLLHGLIETLLQRYATPLLTTTPEETVDTSFIVEWGGTKYQINNAGEIAARQVVQDLSDCVLHTEDRSAQLIALAQTLKKNLPATGSRLTLPEEDHVKHLEDINGNSAP